MDILQEVKENNKKTFFNHVFNMNEESKGEIFNIFQYAIFAIIPIVILNKLVHKFIPEADLDKSSLELSIEILLQLLFILGGIILIHRVITFIPTYSGFKYENLNLTSVILAFLIIILSIQTKMGIKVNILYDRLMDLWNGNSNTEQKYQKKRVRISEGLGNQHTPSQADNLDGSQSAVFPPAPVVASVPRSSGGGNNTMPMMDNYDAPLMPANSVLGSAFGSSF
jgi:hypothetical protein